MEEAEILTDRGAGPIGRPSQTIWLKDIDCEGTEEHLTQCKHSFLENSDSEGCIHQHDVRMR